MCIPIAVLDAMIPLLYMMYFPVLCSTAMIIITISSTLVLDLIHDSYHKYLMLVII